MNMKKSLVCFAVALMLFAVGCASSTPTQPSGTGTGAGTGTSARAFVMGADIDPSFDRPLPIGGLNILDFNFLKRNLQLALLYGGVIALGNVQRANLWGGRFDASVDFFGLALKSNGTVVAWGNNLGPNGAYAGQSSE